MASRAYQCFCGISIGILVAFQPVFLRYFNHQTVPASKSGHVAAFQSLYPQILKLAYNVLMTFHSEMNIHMGVDGLHPSLRLSYYFIST